MRRKSFCSGWAPGPQSRPINAGPHGQGPCSSLGFPQLPSMPWVLDPTQRHGMDISEIHPTHAINQTFRRYHGNAPLKKRLCSHCPAQPEMPHSHPWDGSVPPRHKRIHTWVCRKGFFTSPAALRSTVLSYAYPMGLYLGVTPLQTAICNVKQFSVLKSGVHTTVQTPRLFIAPAIAPLQESTAQDVVPAVFKCFWLETSGSSLSCWDM